MAYRNGAAVKLTDVGQVLDGVEDKRNLGIVNGKPGVLLFVYKQPGANVVETINAVKEALPQITAALPGGIDIKLTGDRSATIRASLSATEETLLVAVGLVILVVFAFLRSWRATLIPAVAVPISIIGTFSAMYLLGYSLNILSLTALIIGTGFVVDDAIVVLENVQRHIEEGKPRLQAALIGAREVGFTVISMSLSLIAVFLPILLMGGLVGRIFQEFSVTLSLSILISLVLSLTTTPMMCARLLRAEGHGPDGETRAGPPAEPADPDPGGGLLPAARRLRADPRGGARPSAPRAAEPARHGRPQRLPLRDRPEGLLPRAGYRADDGRHPGRPAHLVPVDGEPSSSRRPRSSARTRRWRASSASRAGAAPTRPTCSSA